MKSGIVGAAVAAAVCGTTLARAQTTTMTPDHLTIQADSTVAKVSPTLYGLMTEEINHSYDGGLYAEEIQNRIFQDSTTLAHWSAVTEPASAEAITIDTTNPVNTVALTRSLRVDITKASKSGRAGVANDGFWGIPVAPSTRYHASFYARASQGFSGPLVVDIESNDGKTTYASAMVSHLTPKWVKYDVTLVTKKNIAASTSNRFVMAARHTGTVWLSLVSLFPPTYHNRPNGNRVDLMERLAEFQPTFLRLPGGNYLQGDQIANRFIWKNTIGPLEQRPGHLAPWTYRSSDGLGLLEFLEWCEDLHIAPVLAVYAGFSLNGDHVNPGPGLAPYVQDALDEVEYATGDQTTLWGQRRAKDGHPAPFALTYVEVSNEDGSYDMENNGYNYDGRFAQFYDAIKAKYPKLQIIATDPVRTRAPDVIDEHYYKSLGDMKRFAADHFDSYVRSGPKIFVGEWATIPGNPMQVVGNPTPTFDLALADAAWLTDIERNSDLIVMSCYAPLLANVNPHGAQWRTNLIGYDALHNFGSTSYYVQKMFMTHVGQMIVPAHLSQTLPPAPLPGKHATPQSLYASVTRDTSSGTIIVKVVNVDSAAHEVQIDIHGASTIKPQATVEVLTGGLQDANTLANPTQVAPKEADITDAAPTFHHLFPAHSVSVMILSAK